MSVMTKPHWKKILFFVLRPDCCLVFVDVLYISADCPAAESVHESVEWSSAVCSYNTIKASEVNGDFSLLDSHTGECVANSPQRDTGKENIPVCVLFRCLYFSLSLCLCFQLWCFFFLCRDSVLTQPWFDSLLFVAASTVSSVFATEEEEETLAFLCCFLILF